MQVRFQPPTAAVIPQPMYYMENEEAYEEINEEVYEEIIEENTDENMEERWEVVAETGTTVTVDTGDEVGFLPVLVVSKIFGLLYSLILIVSFIPYIL